MKRYETDVREGVLHLETPGGWLEVGEMDAICELIGGETYTLEYDNRQRQVGWLDTDEDGRLSFEVRETIRDTTFDSEFVEAIANAPLDEDDEDGYPKRTAAFADMLTAIWDGKGKL
ncbi:hypothetical protein L593_07430 [Salinarchaeum sp. Harcht-Bsk1]|uniref:hypothetical protein n=1 Tax=Salinarchaeum sp. Harcht-Bsk1 TaxID=1333523 RepID=UPI0003423493|nr:hypothetical protein [Salinarchaeum sp. Harcht-Bsk1]AGN01431.1 hypothetical protein L593_07430 [Salinarchaeum sp. Harcht-Bsk1]